MADRYYKHDNTPNTEILIYGFCALCMKVFLCVAAVHFIIKFW